MTKNFKLSAKQQSASRQVRVSKITAAIKQRSSWDAKDNPTTWEGFFTGEAHRYEVQLLSPMSQIKNIYSQTEFNYESFVLKDNMPSTQAESSKTFENQNASKVYDLTTAKNKKLPGLHNENENNKQPSTKFQYNLSVNQQKFKSIFSNRKYTQQIFFNRCFDKNRMKLLVSWSLQNCGQKLTIDLIENLKNLGFSYATQAGISLGVDDLKIPDTKNILISTAEKNIKKTNINYKKEYLSGIEKFQHLIDTWHRTSEILKEDVIAHFRLTDILNPVYMMAFSGARGNVSQVRQLVGMRGLMSDPQGQILDFPIKSNFREGITLTEYIISCYGARKGLVDTALKTANSGYLTRRLVDVSHHIIVSDLDCKTKRGVIFTDIFENKKIIVPLKNRLIGRILAENIYSNASTIDKATNYQFQSPKILHTTSLSQKSQAYNFTSATQALPVLPESTSYLRAAPVKQRSSFKAKFNQDSLYSSTQYKQKLMLNSQSQNKQISSTLKVTRESQRQPLLTHKYRVQLLSNQVGNTDEAGTRLAGILFFYLVTKYKIFSVLYHKFYTEEILQNQSNITVGSNIHQQNLVAKQPASLVVGLATKLQGVQPASLVVGLSPTALLGAKRLTASLVPRKMPNQHIPGLANKIIFQTQSTNPLGIKYQRSRMLRYQVVSPVCWSFQERTSYLTSKRFKLTDVLDTCVPGALDFVSNWMIYFLISTSETDIALDFRLGTEYILFSNYIICYTTKKKLLAHKNQEISVELSKKIANLKKSVLVRSPLTCDKKNSICQLCYGWSLAHGKLVSLGEAVGVLAAQSIGEPGTQLTMRTFHTGGVFSGDIMSEITAPFQGKILFSEFLEGMLIRTPHGKIAFLTKRQGSFQIQKSKFPKKDSIVLKIPALTVLFVRNGEYVSKGQVIAEFSSMSTDANQRIQASQDINSEIEGEVYFKNVLLEIRKKKNILISRTTCNLGNIWILSGKICQQAIPINLFLQPGDLVNKNSIIGQYETMSAYSGFRDFLRSQEVATYQVPDLKRVKKNIPAKQIVSWYQSDNKISGQDTIYDLTTALKKSVSKPRLATKLQIEADKNMLGQVESTKPQKSIKVFKTILSKFKARDSNQVISSKTASSGNLVLNTSKNLLVNTKDWLRYPLISYPVNSIQYRKIGYLFSFFQKPKFQLTSIALKQSALKYHQFFLSNSLKQNFLQSNALDKKFFFQSFPIQYQTKTGGKLIYDNFYLNKKAYSGEIFWVSQETYLVSKQNCYINLINYLSKAFTYTQQCIHMASKVPVNKQNRQLLRPTTYQQSRLAKKINYRLLNKNNTKFLSKNNVISLCYNAQGKFFVVYPKLSGYTQYSLLSRFIFNKINRTVLKRKLSINQVFQDTDYMAHTGLRKMNFLKHEVSDFYSKTIKTKNFRQTPEIQTASSTDLATEWVNTEYGAMSRSSTNSQSRKSVSFKNRVSTGSDTKHVNNNPLFFKFMSGNQISGKKALELACSADQIPSKKIKNVSGQKLSTLKLRSGQVPSTSGHLGTTLFGGLKSAGGPLTKHQKNLKAQGFKYKLFKPSVMPGNHNSKHIIPKNRIYSFTYKFHQISFHLNPCLIIFSLGRRNLKIKNAIKKKKLFLFFENGNQESFNDNYFYSIKKTLLEIYSKTKQLQSLGLPAKPIRLKKYINIFLNNEIHQGTYFNASARSAQVPSTSALAERSSAYAQQKKPPEKVVFQPSTTVPVFLRTFSYSNPKLKKIQIKLSTKQRFILLRPQFPWKIFSKKNIIDSRDLGFNRQTVVDKLQRRTHFANTVFYNEQEKKVVRKIINNYSNKWNTNNFYCIPARKSSLARPTHASTNLDPGFRVNLLAGQHYKQLNQLKRKLVKVTIKPGWVFLQDTEHQNFFSREQLGQIIKNNKKIIKPGELCFSNISFDQYPVCYECLPVKQISVQSNKYVIKKNKTLQKQNQFVNIYRNFIDGKNNFSQNNKTTCNQRIVIKNLHFFKLGQNLFFNKNFQSNLQSDLKSTIFELVKSLKLKNQKALSTCCLTSSNLTKSKPYLKSEKPSNQVESVLGFARNAKAVPAKKKSRSSTSKGRRHQVQKTFYKNKLGIVYEKILLQKNIKKNYLPSQTNVAKIYFLKNANFVKSSVKRLFDTNAIQTDQNQNETPKIKISDLNINCEASRFGVPMFIFKNHNIIRPYQSTLSCNTEYLNQLHIKHKVGQSATNIQSISLKRKSEVTLRSETETTYSAVEIPTTKFIIVITKVKSYCFNNVMHYKKLLSQQNKTVPSQSIYFNSTVKPKSPTSNNFKKKSHQKTTLLKTGYQHNRKYQTSLYMLLWSSNKQNITHLFFSSPAPDLSLKFSFKLRNCKNLIFFKTISIFQYYINFIIPKNYKQHATIISFVTNQRSSYLRTASLREQPERLATSNKYLSENLNIKRSGQVPSTLLAWSSVLETKNTSCSMTENITKTPSSTPELIGPGANNSEQQLGYEKLKILDTKYNLNLISNLNVCIHMAVDSYFEAATPGNVQVKQVVSLKSVQGQLAAKQIASPLNVSRAKCLYKLLPVYTFNSSLNQQVFQSLDIPAKPIKLSNEVASTTAMSKITKLGRRPYQGIEKIKLFFSVHHYVTSETPLSYTNLLSSHSGEILNSGVLRPTSLKPLPMGIYLDAPEKKIDKQSFLILTSNDQVSFYVDHLDYRQDNLQKLKNSSQAVKHQALSKMVHPTTSESDCADTNSTANQLQTNSFESTSRKAISKSATPTSSLIVLGKQIRYGTKINSQLGLQLATQSTVDSMVHNQLVIPLSGTVIQIEKPRSQSKQMQGTIITFRKAQPILFAAKGLVSVYEGDIIEKNTLILRLFYQRLKTGDIVQGIPRIEQLFEARKTNQGELLHNSLHQQLEKIFLYYIHLPSDNTWFAPLRSDQSEKLYGLQESGRPMITELHQVTKSIQFKTQFATTQTRPEEKLDKFSRASRYSLSKIQEIIVSSVQRVYRSQGVTIADKHLEIIIRQMTSKVQVIRGGQTNLLPGETVDLDWVEILNESIQDMNKKAKYVPVILGITRKSLETKSFISEASFQETTRVLAKSAIERKTDFLKGLKENVILGNLIPAGTGFVNVKKGELVPKRRLLNPRKGKYQVSTKKLASDKFSGTARQTFKKNSVPENGFESYKIFRNLFFVENVKQDRKLDKIEKEKRERLIKYLLPDDLSQQELSP